MMNTITFIILGIGFSICVGIIVGSIIRGGRGEQKNTFFED